MANRKPQRRAELDPAVAELLAGLVQRQAETQLSPRAKEKKARERAKIQARREQRVTYDLPPVLRQGIKQLAEEQCLPASQLAGLALARFLNSYARGEIDLDELKRPSRSPRYDWNLEIPEALLSGLTHQRKNPQK